MKTPQPQSLQSKADCWGGFERFVTLLIRVPEYVVDDRVQVLPRRGAAQVRYAAPRP